MRHHSLPPAKPIQPRAMALGLFHFNVNYVAGDDRVAHRYCVQAVLPFLDTLKEHPELRVSFETSAWGLEFLDHHYPQAIRRLRSLNSQGRLELICPVYAPTVWPAFPGRDLCKSVDLAQDVLRRMDLTAAGIFFSQEAFFGPGLAAISDRFPVLLCKDDYLRYVTGLPVESPAFRMHDAMVLVGANHLGNETARRQASGKIKVDRLSVFHRKRIATSLEMIASSEPENIMGSLGNVSWYWYHVGNGHHFCTAAHPTEESLFFYDPGWTALNLELLHGLQADGYELATLSEFAAVLAQEDLPELPRVWEGSWNPAKSGGMLSWMGQHAHGWEDASGVLGKAWRSRGSLRNLERTAAQPSANAEVASVEAALLDELWKQQILAESSDPLGWEPTEQEVRYGLDASDKVLRGIAEFCSRSLRGGQDIFCAGEDFSDGGLAPVQSSFVCLTVGKRSRVQLTTIAPGLQACEVWFRHRRGSSGVRFEDAGSVIRYTPSGLEGTTVALELAALPQPAVALPLANGLISLSGDRHIIRMNCFGQVAAKVLRNEQAVEFVVEGPGANGMHHWQFLLAVAPLRKALAMAERLNQI